MNNDIYHAVTSRDGSALSRMSSPYHEPAKVVNSEAERLVDSLFRQLKQIFPAAGNTNLRTEADEDTAKKQWIAAFAEARPAISRYAVCPFQRITVLAITRAIRLLVSTWRPEASRSPFLRRAGGDGL